jgi:hypothetical protein
VAEAVLPAFLMMRMRAASSFTTTALSCNATTVSVTTIEIVSRGSTSMLTIAGE